MAASHGIRHERCHSQAMEKFSVIRRRGRLKEVREQSGRPSRSRANEKLTPIKPHCPFRPAPLKLEMKIHRRPGYRSYNQMCFCVWHSFSNRYYFYPEWASQTGAEFVDKRAQFLLAQSRGFVIIIRRERVLKV